MIYLDNAATSYPKPEVVYKTNDEALRNTANPGRGAYPLAIESARRVFSCRNTIKKFIGAGSSKNIIFTKNCTEALNMAIFGSLQPGDHVVTTVFEHNSILRPLQEQIQRGVEVSFVEPKTEDLIRDIMAEIRPNTRLVAVSHVDNLVGYKKDIVTLGNRLDENILFLVDAAQSIGHIKIDVEEAKIDFLAAPGHKSLFGPMGTGFLYIREPEYLLPFMHGGTGSVSLSLVQPDFSPDKFEAGTLNVPGVSALEAGIQFIEGIGLDKITDKIYTLTKRLFDGLKDIKNVKLYSLYNESLSSIVSLNIDGMDSGELSDILARDFDIATRSQMHCAPLSHKYFETLKTGMVRFSPGYFNTEEDIDAAIKAIEKIASEK